MPCNWLRATRFGAVSSGFEDYLELRPIAVAALRELLPPQLDEVGFVSDAPWILSEFVDIAQPVTNHPERKWRALVAVDALWRTPNITARLAADGQLYFVSITAAKRRQSFSATGYLWASGLSVIDVERPLIPTEGEVVELAQGVARWTPSIATGIAAADAVS